MARESITSVTIPLLLIVAGTLFLVDYSGRFSVGQTWPVILILLGLSLAVQSMAGAGEGEASRSAPRPRRRKSLFGPIVLIAAGALLLARNFWPEIPLRAWFAGYWPWILILWGGVRLFEVVLARLLGWSLPRRLGAGAVFAALLLVLVGSRVRASHEGRGFNFVTIPAFEFLQDTYDFPVERSHHDLTGGALVLKNLRGRVHIVGADQEQLVIRGKKRIRAADRQEASELDSRSPLEVSPSDGETTIAIGWMEDAARKVSFDLQLEAPMDITLQAERPLREVSVESISGAVSLSPSPRLVQLSRIGGPVRIRVERGRKVEGKDLASGFELDGNTGTLELTRVKGPVDIRGELFGTIRLAELQGTTKIQSKNGELRFGGLSGEVEVKVRSVSGSQIQGPVRLNSDHWRRVTLERLRGDVEIQGQRMDVELSTDESFGDIEVTLGRGDIELRLPDGAKFTLDAVTDRGNVRQPFGEQLRSEKRGAGSSLQGSTGEGPRIQLRTQRGNIVIRGASSGNGDSPKVTRIHAVVQDHLSRVHAAWGLHPAQSFYGW